MHRIPTFTRKDRVLPGAPEPPPVQPIHPTRRIVIGLLAGISFLSPVLDGALDEGYHFRLGALLLSGAIAVMVSWLAGVRGRMASFGWPIIVVVLSLALSITAVDLVARPLTNQQVYYRPEEMFIQRWSPMPLVRRYKANVSYEGITYGDLAAILGIPEYREVRPLRFVTDSAGFPNDTPDITDIDVIILGDSFGVGVSTSLEQTWGAVLARQYDLSIYNLSIGGSGPSDEYFNLAVEAARLSSQEDTPVVWMLYTGNDLANDPLPTLDIDRLPWNTPIEAARTSFQMFRFRSPIHQFTHRLIMAGAENPVVIRTFLDGRPMLFNKADGAQAALTLSEVEAHPHYSILAATIAAVNHVTTSHHLKLFIVVAPTKEEVYQWVLEDTTPWSSNLARSGFSQAVQDIAQQDGICVIDLKPLLIDEARRVYESEGQSLWWMDDTHWNVTGHSVVAQLVHDQLCLDDYGQATCCGKTLTR